MAIDPLTITYIWGGGLIAFMIILMIFLTILFLKLTKLSKVVKSMQRHMSENNNNNLSNPAQDFHIRRPNQVKLGSEYGYTNPESPQNDEVQRRGFSPAPQNPAQNRNPNPMQNDDYRFGGQPQKSSLLGVPGKKEAPKPPPKNVLSQNDNYLSPNYSEDPFRKTSYMSDDMFRNNSAMSNDNYSKNNPSRTKSNLDNNNFFY